MTVCLTIVWMIVFTVKLESINTVTARQIIYSSHNGTVPVQVSSNQQQQDDELLCEFTGSEVQEVRCSKFFGLMKSCFDETTHRRLLPPPTDASELIWNIRLASSTVVRLRCVCVRLLRLTRAGRSGEPLSCVNSRARACKFSSAR